MRRNRIRREDYMPRQPHPPTSTLPTGAFLLCPVPFLQNLSLPQWLFVHWVHQQALEQAQAILQPSLPERDLLGVWN